MTVAIISLITTVLGIIWYLARRRIESRTPYETARENIAREIIQDDAESANRRLDSWLHDPALRSNKQRQGNSEGKKGTDTGSIL